ncbi:hypothetical protein CRG98_028766, partial [Punica granatum]
DLKDFARETLLQHNVIISDYDKLQSCLKQKISQLESEKVQLHRHFDDLQKQIEDLKNDRHNSEKSLTALKEQQESEMLELLVQIQNLQKENSGLSSSALAKERETLRKDLEKTKLKLKETEFKLKNAVQEKTKLEGEKASAEREIKLLHGQKALLERDINKRESLAGRRRESVMIDSKRSRTQTVTVDQTMQEEYRQLEVLAFEMESTIASLEEELAAAKHENGDLTSKNESLASELEYQSEKIGLLNLELNKLHEEVEKLNLELQESNSYKQQMEISIIKMAEEKEELALQLSESLLEMEEEKAIWCSKERASLQALEEKAKLYNVEKASLSKEMEKVRKELQSWKENCNALGEELRCSEEDVEREKKCSEDKIVEIEQLKNDLRLAVSENEKQAQENLSDQLLSMTYDRDRLKMHCEELQRHVLELESSKRSYDNKEKTEDSKEKAKLRIRLRWTQAKLDAFRHRYTEVLNDRELMDRKYEEASAKLKGRLAESAVEVLNLTKQLAAARGLRS